MRDILVFSESFKRWSGGVEYAARLADSLDANLTGIWVCASPLQAMPSFEPVLFAELLDATLDLEQEAFAAAAAFEAHVRQFGQRKAAWQVAEGHVPEVIALAGSWHDLLVVERSERAIWGTPASVGNIVLGAGGLPCIVAPEHAATRVPALDTVAIAWNGSTEATRAAHAALPLLQGARRIVILQGEVTLITETGEVTLKAGDFFIDRGINHAWRNDGSESCVAAAVILPAHPVGSGRNV